jgi:hypothetical protein
MFNSIKSIVRSSSIVAGFTAESSTIAYNKAADKATDLYDQATAIDYAQMRTELAQAASEGYNTGKSNAQTFIMPKSSTKLLSH